MKINFAPTLKDFKYKISYGLAWLPDTLYLSILYYFAHHRKLHIKNPERFSEKVQYYKIHYHNPEMIPLTDKYNVREYVADKIGNVYLNSLYQVVDKAEDIDFDSLPKKYVIKTTDGGSGANVFICHDGTKIDRNRIIKLVNGWKGKKYYLLTREYAYGKNIKSRIIVEEYLSSSTAPEKGINDYKFLCFNGVFKYLWVDTDRFSEHKRAWYDNKFNLLNVRNGFEQTEITLPDNISEMAKLAEKLAGDFPLARIDFYNIDGRIIFGEITFYPGSGFEKFIPDTFDYTLGKCFSLDW